MQLHTPDEFIKDIERFEICDTGDGTFNVKCTGVRFLKLYSECFEKKLSVDDWYNNFYKRVNELFCNPNVLLPTCDIYPDNDKAFYIYRVNWTPRKLIREARLTLLGAKDTNEDAAKYFESEHETQICIVSTQTDEVMYFDRSIH